MSGRLCCKKSNKVKAFLLLLCFIHHCSPVKSFHSEEKLSPDIDVLLIPLTLLISHRFRSCASDCADVLLSHCRCPFSFFSGDAPSTMKKTDSNQFLNICSGKNILDLELIS